MLPASPIVGNASQPGVVLTWYGAGTHGGATLGDQFAVENLSARLTARGIQHSVLSAYPISVRARVIRDHRQVPEIGVLVHVCGPLLPTPFLMDLAKRAKVRIAVGVSVLDRFEPFNDEFDAIVVRDGQQPETFDLAPARFADAATPPVSRSPPAPAIGLCLRGNQKEYGGAAIFHDKADDLFASTIARSGGASHTIDTLLRSDNVAAGIVAAFQRADVIATTRMHGAILGLSYGKPVIAIDQVAGGAKVASLLGRVGWPLVFRGDSVTQDDIDDAFAKATSPEIGEIVARCRAEVIRLSMSAVETSVRTIAAMASMTAGSA